MVAVNYLLVLSGQHTEADSGPLTMMSASHSLWDNPISKAWSAPNAVHCWNCGDVGHLKDDWCVLFVLLLLVVLVRMTDFDGYSMGIDCQ